MVKAPVVETMLAGREILIRRSIPVPSPPPTASIEIQILHEMEQGDAVTVAQVVLLPGTLRMIRMCFHEATL
jgi:hypothetical protein